MATTRQERLQLEECVRRLAHRRESLRKLAADVEKIIVEVETDAQAVKIQLDAARLDEVDGDPQ